jgi:hypothetical protein
MTAYLLPILIIILLAIFRMSLIRWGLQGCLIIHLFLSPIHAALYTVIGLILLETFTDLLVLYKKKGNALKQCKILYDTLGKLILYQVALIVTHIVERTLIGGDVLLLKGVAMIIAIIELVAIAENTQKLSNNDRVISFIVRLLRKEKDIIKDVENETKN